MKFGDRLCFLNSERAQNDGIHVVRALIIPVNLMLIDNRRISGDYGGASAPIYIVLN
jgi:hypothetical protein